MSEIILKRNFIKTGISSLLKCPICFDVFNKPRRLYCGHTFCKPCLKQLFKPHKNPEHIVKCPLCRERIDIKKIGYDLIVSKIIDELEVSCPVKGCIWQGENQLLITHYQYQCKMKQYMENNNKTIEFENQLNQEKQEDLQEKLNQNVQKASLIARVVTKNHPQIMQRRQSQNKIKNQKIFVTEGTQTDPVFIMDHFRVRQHYRQPMRLNYANKQKNIHQQSFVNLDPNRSTYNSFKNGPSWI